MKEDREILILHFMRFGFLINEKAPKLHYCIRFSFVETFLLEPKFWFLFLFSIKQEEFKEKTRLEETLKSNWFIFSFFQKLVWSFLEKMSISHSKIGVGPWFNKNILYPLLQMLHKSLKIIWRKNPQNASNQSIGSNYLCNSNSFL